MRKDKRNIDYAISFVSDGTPEGIKNTMVIRIDLDEYAKMHKFDVVVFLHNLFMDILDSLLAYEEVE